MKEEIYFDECLTLLKSYKVMKYCELSKSSFEYIEMMTAVNEKSVAGCVIDTGDIDRCTRLAKSKFNLRPQNEFCQIIKGIMEEALFDTKNETFQRVLKSLYFEKKSFDDRFPFLLEELSLKKSRLYEIKGEAIKVYSRNLLMIYSKSHRDFHEDYHLFLEYQNLHEPSGECYADTEKLLKSYSRIAYKSVGNRMKDGKLYDWMNSSMMENTYSYLIILDEVLRRMKQLGGSSRMYANLINEAFFNEVNIGLTADEKISKLNMSQREYYDKRKQGISLFSKILWGFSGYRHSFKAV